MITAQKIARLMELADQGPVMRAALAEEVADLLVNWPENFPDSMKSMCETLLAKAAREVDVATRARLRVRLYNDPGLAHRVLGRKQPAAQALVQAARQGELESVLADRLGLDAAMAKQILDDETGAALAVACKGASIDRAAFSALALLTHPARDRDHALTVLDAFDTVPAGDASRLLRDWRGEDARISA